MYNVFLFAETEKRESTVRIDSTPLIITRPQPSALGGVLDGRLRPRPREGDNQGRILILEIASLS